MKYFPFFTLIASLSSFAGTVTITMDNPNTYSGPIFTGEKRDQKIRETLKTEKLKVILFASGYEIEDVTGQSLLKKWDDEGHIIGNHTYSHKSYNTSAWTFERYSNDILKNEPFINHFKNFKKYFRFVMLKEGDTAEKRDRMRSFFDEHGYQHIPVTIDASDWYINQRLLEKLKQNPKTNLKPYRDYYLAHIWDRTKYYDQLATKITGRDVKHTLLIHHNLLNALFLGDLIKMFRENNWKVVNPEAVLDDPIFSIRTKTIPAGESIIWSLAKETGKYDGELRYPGENDTYEKPAMDKLGL